MRSRASIRRCSSVRWRPHDKIIAHGRTVAWAATAVNRAPITHAGVSPETRSRGGTVAGVWQLQKPGGPPSLDRVACWNGGRDRGAEPGTGGDGDARTSVGGRA